MLETPIIFTLVAGGFFLLWIQPRELRPLWNAKPLPAFEPRHELTAILLRSFRRAQRAAAVIAISMLSAVVAVQLTSTTTETGFDHWVGDNAYLLGVMLVTLWFALVTECSISLWRLAKDDPVSFNHRDLSWTIGVGFLVAFFALITVWFWYQVATGS